MKYRFSNLNNSLIISDEQNVILTNIKIRINYIRSKNISYIPSLVEENGYTTTVNFKREEPRGWGPEAKYVKIIFREEKGALLATVDFACNHDMRGAPYNYTYAAFESAFIDFSVPENKGGMLNLHSTIPLWLTPSFARDMKDFKSFLETEVGSLSYNVGNDHVHILPLINSDTRTHIETEGFVMDTCVGCKTEINSAAFLIASAESPFDAIKTNVLAGRALNEIIAPTLEEKEIPNTFDGFGWCTWNAFYKDVTSEKIYNQLEEFQKMGIKIKWLLVDDGWQSTENRRLLSIEEDKEKFPEGLKAFTEKVKKDYGIKYIGVWHAIEGYWDGISKDGELYQNNKDLFFETPTGFIVPGPTEENAFKFWDMQHGYLKEQGIDFVKADNQGAASNKYDNILPGGTSVQRLHAAIDKSVFKHFGGSIINCMG
ncbi:MAG: alpha-galactosidase, partial [Clostridia bacterium]|nr:alpha-galactosidase [Clostridia bacterium]